MKNIDFQAYQKNLCASEVENCKTWKIVDTFFLFKIDIKFRKCFES